MSKPTRLLNTPEIPSRAWMTEDSPDFVMGQTLHVVTSGSDEGRAYGLIQPPPNLSAFMPGRMSAKHRNRGRRPPDARLYADNFTTFNRGAFTVADDDGSVSTIAAGVLPLFGGHAHQAIGATNIDQAVEWLHREGKWTHEANALGLVGVASAVDAPGYEGAVMFRGAALPGMTAREALYLNGVSTSAEVWESPHHENQLVFAGAVICDHTAWPYAQQPDALAAAAGEDECVGPFCTVFAADGQVLEDPESFEPPVAAPRAAATVEVDLSSLTPSEGLQVGSAVDPHTINTTTSSVMFTTSGGFVAAEVTEEQVTNLTERVDQVASQIEDLSVEIAELAVTVFGGPKIGERNEVEDLRTQIAELHAMIQELQRSSSLRQPTEENTTAAPNASRNNIAPAPTASTRAAAQDLSSSLRG